MWSSIFIIGGVIASILMMNLIDYLDPTAHRLSRGQDIFLVTLGFISGGSLACLITTAFL